MGDMINRDHAAQAIEAYLCSQCDYDIDRGPECIACSYLDGYEILKSVPAVNRWIPCSERLPEVDVPVLTYDGKYVMVERHIEWIDADGEELKGEWWIDGIEGDNYYCVGLRDGAATHWMPLPEPPEKE